MIKYIQNCRLCGCAYLETVLDLGYQHVQGVFLTKNNPNPPRRKIPNVIVRCDPKKGGCSLVQSNIVVPPELLFSSYFYRSGINESMKQHLKDVVNQLLTYNSNPKRVTDLANNDNTLLLNYPKEVEKWGIDPNNIAQNDKENDITVINDFFPCEQPLALNNDFCTALAVLYDVFDPILFVRRAIELLKPVGIFCFEVMYLPSIIQNLAYDTFLAEHQTHWSLFTIEKLVKRCGGRLIDVKLTPTNGGSILVFVAKEDCLKYNNKEKQNNILELKKPEFDLALDCQDVFVDFRNRVETHIRDLQTTISKLKKENKKICLYAVSTKANVICEAAKIEQYFTYGIERSEEKVGGQTLWGLPIVSEEEARKDADENTVWFVGPYFYKGIVDRERKLGFKGQFLFPLPNIEIFKG